MPPTKLAHVVFQNSPAFDRNPIGVQFDPDELAAKFRSGVPVADLVARD